MSTLAPTDGVLKLLVRILGRIGADLADDTRFDPPSGPQRRLLALLAMRAGRPVTSETLCDLFDLSSGAVRTTVSRLRKSLGADALTTTAGGYVLDVETDAQQFQTAVTRARSLPADRAADELMAALEMFNGPALDEFADEPWATSEVTRLNELRAAVVEDLVAIRLEQQLFDEALDLLHPHIEAFPYRDRPRELMMRALALSGRQVEALRAYQDYRSVLVEDVGVDPSDALRDLERQISAGDVGPKTAPANVVRVVPRSPVSTLTNLQALPNEFIGRGEDQVTVAQALSETRLVTLLGPGGVGKTRLAFQVASNQVGLHSDGVWAAELVDCEGQGDIVRTVADVVGTRASTFEELAEQLAGRDLLLVLDNCEHVINHVHDLAETLLEGTTRLRLIATSRSPIKVVGERVIPVGPLAAKASVELYETRARAVGVEIFPAERAIVEEICAQLDGVPLALELAAASSRVLAPADLRAQLHRRFEVLKGVQRGKIAGRHDSLLAAVDSSYLALDKERQIFFNRLSVFAGEFPLSAVEAVTADLSDPSFDLVSDLVDMSMLVAHRTPSGTRYRMLETLRHYGVDRLTEGGSLELAENRQIDWCFAYCDEQVAAAFGASEGLSLDGLVSAAPNFRLAASRLVERGQAARAIDLVIGLDDLAYASNTLATLAGPLIELAEAAGHPGIQRLQAMELLRRSTTGSSDSRHEIAAPLAAALTVETAGPIMLPVLLIATALDAGVSPVLLDEIETAARSHPDVAERARLLVAAGFGRYYGDELPDGFDLVEEALDAATHAGMKRLRVAAASMACIGGLRIAQPAEGARIARPVLGDLDDLRHPSIMASGLVTLYTEAAIQADLAPSEHLSGIRRAGPNLHGDFNRLGLALARVVQHHGHHALAVRAAGAVEQRNRSGISTTQIATILEVASDHHDSREIDSLQASGSVSEQSDLYRELWSVIESMITGLPG